MAFAKSSSPKTPFHTACGRPDPQAPRSDSTKVAIVWNVSVDWSDQGEVIDNPLLLSVNIDSEAVTIVG